MPKVVSEICRKVVSLQKLKRAKNPKSWGEGSSASKDTPTLRSCWCFPVNIGKFSKTLFFTEHLWWLLLNVAYSDFINKFKKAIDSVTPIKKVRKKANSKSWFHIEIISVIQKRDKLYARYKKPGLEMEKNNFKTAKTFLQKMMYRKKLLFRGKASSDLEKTYRIKEIFQVSWFKF